MKRTVLVLVLSVCGLFSACDKDVISNPPVYQPREIVMKDIPAGTFSMGADDYSASTSQRPVHTVTVSAFSIQETEVTQGQYVAIMGVNPSHLQFSNEPEDRENPVELVTWYDAVLYCNKLSKKENRDTVYTYTSMTKADSIRCTFLDSLQIDYSKKGYRLPTEAEWEYACRGGTTTIYWWGDWLSGMDTTSWCLGNSRWVTHYVASKAKNPYGLYDMPGNVWEWCNDFFGWYDSTSQSDPQGPDTLVTNNRVVRGGSWYDDCSYLRSAFRHSQPPFVESYYIGFRVVLPK